MHRRRILLALLALVIPVGAVAAPGRSVVGGPRIRPHDDRSATLFLEGLQRSDTLRAIVDRLETHDVIVYLQMQPGLKSRLAGRLTWMTAASRFRYVRVSLNPELSGDIAIATLGHELQHALEVANEPSIVNATSLDAFYRKNGISIRAHEWDTDAARDVGDAVRKDLAGTRGLRVTETTPVFDPLEWDVVYRSMRERGRDNTKF